MLIHRDTGTLDDDDVSSVHNYYEHLVIAALRERQVRQQLEVDTLADIMCVALNHLPPRYIRHDVDMSFYLSPAELYEIERKVAEAVDAAVRFVQDKS